MLDDDARRDEPTELDGAIRRRFEQGRAAWPDIALPFDLFERYAARHAIGERPPAEAFAADMYLACACAHGVDAAIAQLERILAGDVARAVASVAASPEFVEEVLQGTRERLLVRKGHAPAKLADYAGRASLKSWVRVVAVRWAISQRRRKMDGQREPLPLGADRRLAQGGPEFDYLRGRYKRIFEEAVRGAVERLPARERVLLRLNLVDGMTVERLGAMYQVGRSTAARWLTTARRALLEQTHRELRATLRITSTELESLGADIRSQLEVSLLRLLAR